MTGLGNECEASVGQRLGVGTAIVRVHDAITLAPDDEGWNLHAPKSATQLQIMHPLPLIVQFERLKVCSDGCDPLRTESGRVDAEGRRVVVTER